MCVYLGKKSKTEEGRRYMYVIITIIVHFFKWMEMKGYVHKNNDATKQINNTEKRLSNFYLDRGEYTMQTGVRRESTFFLLFWKTLKWV